MKTLAAAVIAISMATPAFASPAASSHAKLKKMWSEMEETGGHGNPLTEVPTAVADKLKEAMEAIAGGQDDSELADQSTAKAIQ